MPHNSTKSMTPFEIGQTPPAWHLESIGSNDPVPAVGDFVGKPLLILFFYLGCPGCKGRAVPFANRVVYERGDRMNVVGIHSNFEGPEFTDEEITSTMEALYGRFPVYRDAGIATTFHDYEAAGTPHWVLLDRSGTVIDTIFGSDPNRALLRLDYHLDQLDELSSVGFGGGCHWCTEAVFQSLKGVEKVEQGWIGSDAPHDTPSEAVVVHFRPDEISLETLIEIHLLTHSSTSEHDMRSKYRSAIYTFNDEQRQASEKVLENLRSENDQPYITSVLPFRSFKRNEGDLLNYYQTRKDAPFCTTHIDPKLEQLRQQYGALVKAD